MWKDMRIVLLVSRSKKSPKTLDLGAGRLRWGLLSVSLLVMCACVGLGAGVALFFAQPKRLVMAEVRYLQQHAQQQQQTLQAMRGNIRHQLDALAVKLGQLQAQSTRLNALGERLVRIGKVKSDEFNFDQSPPLGGLEHGMDSDYSIPSSMNADINHLATQFDVQRAQLSALQSLLLNERIDSNLKPAGMPIRGGYISSYFGPRRDPFDGHPEFHAGLDVAGPYGTPIHVVAGGMVTFAGVRHGYGKVVEVDHGNGYRTRYAHASKLLVHPGERVRVGQVIAKLGSTGRSTGPHVHFEVWYKGHVVNPLPYVRSHR